jgi:hypothetical protein
MQPLPLFAVVHMRPDGTPHAAGEHVGSWRAALAHGQHVRDVRRAEVARGHAEAGGEVWIVDDRRGTVV